MEEIAIMSQLSEEIKRRADQAGSLRALALEASVSYTGLKNLRDNPDSIPELETLVKLSRAFKVPLWRLIEMSGFDLQFSQTTTVQAQRIADVMDAMPEYQPVVDHLLQLDAGDLDAVLIYLETLQRHRSQVSE
jgi:hypothetical protein